MLFQGCCHTGTFVLPSPDCYCYRCRTGGGPSTRCLVSQLCWERHCMVQHAVLSTLATHVTGPQITVLIVLLQYSDTVFYSVLVSIVSKGSSMLFWRLLITLAIFWHLTQAAVVCCSLLVTITTSAVCTNLCECPEHSSWLRLASHWPDTVRTECRLLIGQHSPREYDFISA